jgi:hypothetical protein
MVPDFNKNTIKDGEDVLVYLTTETNGGRAKYAVANSRVQLLLIYAFMITELSHTSPTQSIEPTLVDIQNPALFASVDTARTSVVACSNGKPIAVAGATKFGDVPNSILYKDYSIQQALRQTDITSAICVRIPARIRSDLGSGTYAVDAPSAVGSFNPTDYENVYLGDPSQGNSYAAIEQALISIAGEPVDGSSRPTPTPTPKSFTITMSPNPVTVGAQSPAGVTAFFKYQGHWLSTDKVTTTITKICQGTVCQPGNKAFALEVGGGDKSPLANSVTNIKPSAEALRVINLSSTDHELEVWVSASSPGVPEITTSFTVKTYVAPWIQIGVAAGTASGDVHSNSSSHDFTYTLPGTHHFFSSLDGLISSRSTIGISSGNVATRHGWTATNYPHIGSPAINIIEAALPIPPVVRELDNHSLHAPIINQGIYQSNTVTVSSPITLDSTTFAQRDIVYVIHGDLHVNANISLPDDSGTLTFIIEGDVTVSADVTEMDGVYLFDGSFTDGRGSAPLTIRGSLINLAKASNETISAQSGTSTIAFQRDLGQNNNSQASEVILYQPKYLVRLKELLDSHSILTWGE